MPVVQAWPDRYVEGWEGGDVNSLVGLQENPQLDLADALRLDNETDAHVVPYVLCLNGEPLPTAPRVNKPALGSLESLGLSLLFGSALVDVDAPKGVEAAGEAAVAEWYERQTEELEVLDPSPRYQYRTRGGYRLVWELSRTIDDPAAFERLGRALRARIREQTGKAVDPCELEAWGYCYRLPGVVRDGERQAYSLEEEAEATPLDVEPLLEGAPKGRKLGGLGSARTPGDIPGKIADGMRNSTVYSVAGRLRRAGLAQAEILAALEAVNERCDPPLGAGELATIARKASKYDHPDLAERVTPAPRRDVPNPYNGENLRLGSEVELADVVLAQLEDDGPQLVYDRGALWQYQPSGIWTELRPSVIKSITANLDGCLVGEQKPRYLKLKASTCSGVLTLAESFRDSPGWLDERAAGVAFKNGVVLAGPGSVELLSHAPEYRITHALPVDYDPAASCPRFDRLLADSFAGCPDAPERIALLAQYVGACFIGRATLYQRALLLYGEGANGKSTFLGVISALVPPGARTAIPPQLLGDQYYRAELADALINVVTEVPESDIVAGEAFKAFIDGSELMARRIYQAPFKFRPRCGHLWACNSLPGVKDYSWGFWRRWLAVEWPNTVAEEDQDEELERRIIEEELAGVARWALDGAADLLAKGRYSVPASSADALERWRKQADQVAAYVEEELDTDTSETVPARQLYDNYKLWAHRSGCGVLSERKFGERLNRLGGMTRATKTRRGRRWHARFRRNPVTPRGPSGSAQ